MISEFGIVDTFEISGRGAVVVLDKLTGRDRSSAARGACQADR